MPRTNTQADAALAEMVKSQQPEQTYTLQQISDRTGLTAERIRQIERQALRKMQDELKTWLTKEGFTEYLWQFPSRPPPDNPELIPPLTFRRRRERFFLSADLTWPQLKIKLSFSAAVQIIILCSEIKEVR